MTERYWEPSGVDRAVQRRKGVVPEVGSVFTHIGSRTAWRALDIQDVAQANWKPATVERWRLEGRPDPGTWPNRERRVLAEPARNPAPNGKDRRGLPLYPWTFQEHWWPLADPYPVCVDCGLVWPCPCKDRNDQAQGAMARLDRMTAVLPGCCWGCAEPITSRQKAVAYPGDNLDLPGGPAVRFHRRGREDCFGSARRYELRWIAQDPRRERILTYPLCGGSLSVHADGVTECQGGEPGCGGHLTHDHRSASACFVRGGCPRGCDRAKHRGTGAQSPRPERRQSVERLI